MVAQSFRCDESRLKSFLDDELPDRENDRLRDHLETCSVCRGSLERLAAGSRLWEELRQLGAGQDAAAGGRDRVSFPKSPHGGPASEFDRSPDFLVASDAPGSLGRLGRYEVTAVLGSGGFGIVLKAFDPALSRVVAIKVLAPQVATSAAARSRFAREARAAAAVVHDHVVAIHAVESSNGLLYLVMPYIAGCSLQERVDRDGPMGTKEVLRIGVQTAQGLAAAHVQGLVHRDIKPSNILLENGVERVKLTDFGLARAVDDASLTQSGVVAGTPQYMSPEQARGEAVDARSDLFSLGSVLYFMCAGHPPFRASSTPAVLRRVSDEGPRPLREINPEIPTWLAEFVEQLHAKDPADRVQSATEAADIMGSYLAALQRGLPILAARSPAVATATRRSSRIPTIAVGCSILAIALAFGPAANRKGALKFLAAVVPAVTKDSEQAPNRTGGNTSIVYVGQDEGKNPRIVGSGKSAAKEWSITDFTGVEIRSTFRARISKGADFKITTTADDNVLPYVRVSKEGSTLKVGLQDNQSYELKTRLGVEITLPALATLDLSGATQASLSGFKGEKELKVKISGASKVDGSLSVDKAEFLTNGASSLALAGSAKTARIEAEGASHLQLGEFLVKHCEIAIEGASTVQLAVLSETPFKAQLSGASRLSGPIRATDVELKLEGASHVAFGDPAKDAEKGQIAGSSPAAESVKVVASGASHFDLSRLAAKNAEVKLSGASHGTVAATGSLNYDLSAGSHLTYRGEPATVKGRKSGGSLISRRR
jgi:serine/threonine-protein kinase